MTIFVGVWTIVRSEILFYNQLYGAITNKHVNVIYSPFNAHTALSLVYQGAAGDMVEPFRRHLKVKNQVVTANQYKSILNEMGHTMSNVSVTMANKIYVKDNYHLKESFKKVAIDFFHADVQAVNFKKRNARKDMVAWLKRRSGHKNARITGLDTISANTNAVLLNTLNFKAGWEYPFAQKETYIDKFYHAVAKFANCNMMRQTDYFEYAESVELEAKIIRLFYVDKKYSKIIVLPNKKFGLVELEKKIVRYDINVLVKKIKLVKKPVDLYIPKFKVIDSIELKDPLTKCGFGNIFKPSIKFSNMVAVNESLRFDKILQSSFLECAERGSFTSSDIGWKRHSRKIVGPPILYKVDHPFLFYITAGFTSVKTANNVLFMGRVENPAVLI